MFCSTISLKSLCNTQIYFRSSLKSRSKRIKYYESKPYLFKRIQLMRPPDLRAPNLIFPLNIPMRIRHIYKPSRNYEYLKEHDFLNFKQMTGNEILSYLDHSSELRHSELCGALLELGKRDKPENVDWNKHEYVISAKELVLTRISQYTSVIVQHLVIAFDRLGINDPILWSSLQRECNKVLHKCNAQTFARLFIIFNKNSEKLTKEFLDRLVALLPIHLWRMSPGYILDIFEILIEKKYLNEYLFEDHFFLLFWRRSKWFGAKYYGRIIKNLVKIKEINDVRFWKDFLAHIVAMEIDFNEESCVSLIEGLQELQNQTKGKLELKELVEFAQKRLIFCRTKLKMIENSNFFNLIMNDISYYKQKSLEKNEKLDKKLNLN